MALSAGTKLGPYEILSAIGAGGMGEVYKATDTRLGRTVAIKVLHRAHSDRFEQEARAIAALNHPNVCTLHDVGPNYLVMEYVEGSALRGPLPPQEAVRLGIQIASALEAAHRRGIIHRDLKPANVMVTRDGSVKLLDFGLSKIAVNADLQDVTPTIERTMDGTVLGTTAYMAPEQTEGRPLDARSDVFSLGAVLYEMVAGRRAFEGRSMAQVLSAVLRDDPRPLDALPALERIVTRCLRKSPADRFQTMAEVQVALEEVSDKPAAPQASIAVLPFANISGDHDNEYFSDGLAEEILNALTHVPGLKVAGRTSSFFFRGKDIEFAEIARKLNVEHILEGSVRKAGNRIRVTAQLIKVADGFHLWSERYDRELIDVFAMQDDIAAAIAGALQLKLSPPLARGRHTPSLPAHEAFLKGRHDLLKLTPESMARSRTNFEHAIELDPEYAMPRTALGSYFIATAMNGLRPARELMPLARAAAQKALDIDPWLPEAHAYLGFVATSFDYDWTEAHRRYQVATAVQPVSALVHSIYGTFYLAPLGRLQEAVEELERAVEEEPLHALLRSELAFALLEAGSEERAIAEFRKVMEIDEGFWAAHRFFGVHYALKGMEMEALAQFERAYQLAPWSSIAVGTLAGALVRTGDVSRASLLIQPLREAPGQTPGVPVGMTFFHLQCSELDAAASWMEKAIEQRDPSVLRLLADPLASRLRHSPRWPALAEMMNLPSSSSEQAVTIRG